MSFDIHRCGAEARRAAEMVPAILEQKVDHEPGELELCAALRVAAPGRGGLSGHQVRRRRRLWSIATGSSTEERQRMPEVR